MIILKSFFEPEFKKYSKKLSPDIREKAKKAFKNFREQDPSNFSRGLEFKHIKGHETLHSIRIDDNYRALGHNLKNGMHWHWIGTHDEYMLKIRQ